MSVSSGRRSARSPMRCQMSRKVEKWDADNLSESTAVHCNFLSTVLTFLVVEKLNISPTAEQNDEDVAKLEEYIGHLVENSSVNSIVNDMLLFYGWNGTHFDPNKFDLYEFHTYCAKLYMHYYVPQSVNDAELFWCDKNNRMEEFSLDKLSSIICFCPNLLLEELHTSKKEKSLFGIAVDSACFFGAVLLVDISGFTTFSSAFCKEGVSGLDKLHTVTSSILGRLVRGVYAHHGDVIYFAGDALICVFKTLEQPKSSDHWDSPICCPALRALQCATELSNFNHENLSVHTALGCGDIYLSTLGGYNGQWTYVLNSRCIAELSSCLDDAGPSEIAFSQAFYDVCVKSLAEREEGPTPSGRISQRRQVLNPVSFRALGVVVPFSIGSDLQCRKMPSGNMLLVELSLRQLLAPHCGRFASLSRDVKLDKMLPAFVPRPVLHSLSIGSLNTLAELRLVTTVFIKLDSYDVEVHENPVTLQSVFYAVQELLGEYGGFLRQFIIDDKGCVVICMWGVPDYSFGNNECRAVDFSCQVNIKLRSLNHRCSIGIATGTIYCGIIGSVARRDYVGIGADVNLAARLMGKAKGSVWIDKMTHDKMPVAGQKCTAAIAPVKVKGFAKHVIPHTFDCDTMPTLCVSADDVSKQKLLRTVVAGTIRQQLSKSLIDGQRKNNNPMVQKYGDDDDHEYEVHSNLTYSHEPCLSRAGSLNRSICPLDKDDNIFLAVHSRIDITSMAASKKPNVNCTVIVGPHGTGKRTAALVYYRHALALGFKVVRIVAKSSNRTAPYSVIRLLFEMLVGKSIVSDDSQRRICLRMLLAEAFPTEGPYTLGSRTETMLRILNFAGSSSHTVQTHDNHDGSLHGCLFILLQSKNYALCFENLQFCDELSWQQLRLLMDMPIHLSIIITLRQNLDENNVIVRPVAARGRVTSVGFGKREYRANHLTTSYFQIAEHKATAVVYMTSLSTLEVRQILAEVLHSDLLSDTLVSFVSDISCANLFWCSTIARYIVAKGIDTFELLIGTEDRSDQTLHGIIVAIYEQLGASQKLAIKHASIIGEEFTDGQLLAVLPSQVVEEDAIAIPSAIMSPLVNRGLIFCCGEQSYQFTNEIIRTVLYELTPPSDAALVHKAFAKHIELEHKNENDLTSFFPLLSYHYTMGMVRPLAFHYSAKSAENAIGCGSYGDALFYLETAVPMVTTVEEALSIKAIVNTAVSDLDNSTHSRRRIFDGMLSSLFQYKLKSEDFYTHFDILSERIDTEILELTTADPSTIGPLHTLQDDSLGWYSKKSSIKMSPERYQRSSCVVS